MNHLLKLLTLKERQEYLLQLLIDTDEFCRYHGIKYSLGGNTLLCAMKFKGFSTDNYNASIYMLRDDYEKFINIYRTTKYNALIYNTVLNKNHLLHGFSKIVNPMTYAFDKHGWAKFGVYLNIYPLDYVPDNYKCQKKFIKKIRRLHNRFYHRHKNDIISIIKSYHHSLDYWWNKIDTSLSLYNNSNSEYVANLIGSIGETIIIPKSHLENLIEVSFEGHSFYALENPNEYLTMIFGDDYMNSNHFTSFQKKDVYLIKEEKIRES